MSPSSVEIIYMLIRLALAAAWVVAGLSLARYIRGLKRNPRPWFSMLSFGIIGIAIAMILYDAIDNVVFNPAQPVPLVSWVWLLFDGLTPIFLFGLIRAAGERDTAYQKLQNLARTDQLTGLPNRRGFSEAAHGMLRERRRGGTRPEGDASSFIMLDLDHFKRVNDSYGHAAGDAVLAGLARVIRQTIRATDIPVRLGGEEIGILLSDSDRAGTAALAERLRVAIKQGVPHPGGPKQQITASLGAAELADGDLEAALEAARLQADAALYRAKTGGRDRVALAWEMEAPALEAS